MDQTLKVQVQIRQNAEELSEYLSDLNKWETNLKKSAKPGKQRQVNAANLPVRKGVGTVPVVTQLVNQEVHDKANSSAKHTYDIGYKKWENFNIDEAIQNIGNNFKIISKYDSITHNILNYRVRKEKYS